MNFSSRFAALDNREAAVLDAMRMDQRREFDRIVAAYSQDFRPETSSERDTVYCLASLRWNIDRIRSIEQDIRDLLVHHGYVPPKIRIALDELTDYQKELQARYDYFFSRYERGQQSRYEMQAGASV